MTNTNGKSQLVEERLTYLVIKAFFRVYNALGFGFLEHVYVRALEVELRRMGLRVSREYSVCVHYLGVELCQYRLDFVVNERLVVEVKSTFRLARISPRLVLNQLRATNPEVALLLHFGPEPRFFRLFAPNNIKAHRQKKSDESGNPAVSKSNPERCPAGDEPAEPNLYRE